jgi:molybdenum cofactor cytidylyltransferase
MANEQDYRGAAPRVDQTIASLMNPPPEQWGLRGDRPLWEEMLERLQDAPLPTTRAELEETIGQAFEVLTGRPLSGSEDQFHVGRLERGGMSSGHVSPHWWRDDAIPMLVARLESRHGR